MYPRWYVLKTVLGTDGIQPTWIPSDPYRRLLVISTAALSNYTLQVLIPQNGNRVNAQDGTSQFIGLNIADVNRIPFVMPYNIWGEALTWEWTVRDGNAGNIWKAFALTCQPTGEGSSNGK